MNETPRVQEPHQEVWQRPFVVDQQEWCGAFVLELRLREAESRRGPAEQG